MKLGWKCPLTGEEFAADDPRLIGRGNPPTIPLAAGMGTCAMQATLVADDVRAKADAAPLGESYVQDAIAHATAQPSN